MHLCAFTATFVCSRTLSCRTGTPEPNRCGDVNHLFAEPVVLCLQLLVAPPRICQGAEGFIEAFGSLPPLLVPCSQRPGFSAGSSRSRGLRHRESLLKTLDSRTRFGQSILCGKLALPVIASLWFCSRLSNAELLASIWSELSCMKETVLDSAARPACLV